MTLVVLAGTLAGLLILHYTFDGPGLATTWPALLVAVGVALGIWGYWVLLIIIGGGAGILLAANLGAFSWRRAWPFTVLLIVIAGLVGYLQARAGKSPGPKSTLRD